TKEDKEKAYYNLGKTYLDERKFDDAEYHFKEALKLNPNDENARTNYNLAKKEIHPEDVGSEGNQENKQPNPNGDEKMEKPSDSDDPNASQKKEENKGSQKDDGENGNEEGKGNLPREQEIIKGSEGKGEEAPQAKSNEYHEGVLRALEQQEQETLKKIISQKAKKVRTNTEKDW